jgi:two-component system NtrC family sensor kinase
VIDRNYQIVLFNEAARKKGMTMGTKCHLVTHKSEKPCEDNHGCPLKQVLTTKKPTIMEHVHYDMNGNSSIVEVHGDPIFDENGEVVQMIEYAIDITDRKKAENALIATKDALEAAYSDLRETKDQLVQSEKLQAIGQLASGVAHEVKNPLGIVLQGAYFLEKKLEDAPENVKTAIFSIKRNIERADRIIRSLVDFSRAAKLTLKPEDINMVLDASLLLMGYKMKEKEINIAREFGEDLPAALIDKVKIEQVLVNIYMNSVHAMPQGGKLIVRSYTVELEKGEKEKGIVDKGRMDFHEPVVFIEIEDNGAGIDKENIPKIFDPFFTLKQPGEGTGLGLAVSRNIIEEHRGVISVESEKGKGTKITIALRIVQEKPLLDADAGSKDG